MIPTVWAPLAGNVELVTFDLRQAMERTRDGWWQSPRSLKDGDRYAFSVDGGPDTPDPRSRLQPDGVHAPSSVAECPFYWTDDGFAPVAFPEAVLYELHVGTFSPAGTFDGVVERLEHLVRLGVSHVELMPICEFPGCRGWGYDGVYPFTVHHSYGGPEGLKRLVNACHQRGLSVLLDVVYNHLGPSGNYLSRFGPYFTEVHHTPWGAAVNLDQADSDEVRRYFCDNALMWFRDYHIDGLRLDAVHALRDDGAYHFLEQLSSEVAELEQQTGRKYLLIAESDRSDPRTIRTRAEGGLGMHAQWCDDLHHALHSVLTGESLGYYSDYGRIEQIADALEYGFVYRNHYSPARRRRHGHPHQRGRLDQLVVALQNHDQVGNRARGERLGHLISFDKLKLASAFVLWSASIPLIFQGEEWNCSSPFLYFTSHEDPELGRLVSEGRRREFAGFGWRPEDVPDPQEMETFARSKLRWEDLESEPHRKTLEWYTALLRTRREHQAECRERGIPINTIDVEVDASRGIGSLKRGKLAVHANFETGVARFEGIR